MVEEVLQKILDNCHPYTIFLYGSRATADKKPASDYEIGVIFEDERYLSRRKLAGLIDDDQRFSIYPFRLSEVVTGNIDTPFQKNVFMNVLARGGAKILYGRNIFKEINVPELKRKDLIEDIYFNLGLALAAIRVFRDSEAKTLAKDMFCKSCLYATRDFFYINKNRLSLSYGETYRIAEEYKDLLGDYYDLVKLAYEIRKDDNLAVPADALYKNISYINKFILENA